MSLREKWAELGTGMKILVVVLVLFGLGIALVIGVLILFAIIGSFVIGVGSEETAARAVQGSAGSLRATADLVATEAVA